MVYEEASQVASDAVSSIRTVASFCAEEKVMAMYEKKCEGAVKQGVKVGVVSGASLGFGSLALYLTYAFCFYIGAFFIHHNKATFTELFRVLKQAKLHLTGLILRF